jgi:hypothetical protein
LPPARIGAAPLRLIRGAESVEAAHHAALGCALFGKEKELRLAKIRELKALWRARGAYGFIYRPGKTDRGLKSWL